MKNPSRIPLDLLETFVCLARHEGDASSASAELDVSQPTMSKRLSALRQFSLDSQGQPWFQLQGKRWLLTTEGLRVFPIVSGLVRQYRETESFLTTQIVSHKPLVSVACGQTTVQGIVAAATNQFLDSFPHSRVRIATPRSRARIEGVAAGLYDLAIVSDSKENIFKIAGRELHLTEVYKEELVVFASPSSNSSWGNLWARLPKKRPIRSEEIINIPLILPEPDSSTRKRVDNWFLNSTAHMPEVVIETGGWQSILSFAKSGHGACIVPSHALSPNQLKASRKLSEGLGARTIKVVANKARKVDKPDLQGVKLSFFESIAETRV